MVVLITNEQIFPVVNLAIFAAFIEIRWSIFNADRESQWEATTRVHLVL